MQHGQKKKFILIQLSMSITYTSETNRNEPKVHWLIQTNMYVIFIGKY